MTPHPKALEAAARAIYEGRNGRGCKPWSLLTNAHKEPYQNDAIAAHKALFDTLEAEGLIQRSMWDATMWNEPLPVDAVFPVTIIREVK